MVCAARARFDQASRSVFACRHTRLTVSLPTAPPNNAARARRTWRVLAPARQVPAIRASTCRVIRAHRGRTLPPLAPRPVRATDPRPRRGRSRPSRTSRRAGGRPTPPSRHTWPSNLLTDTLGLPVVAVVHPAGIQDRDGAPLVLAAPRFLYPWLRHVFADGGYGGAKSATALGNLGRWTIEIVLIDYSVSRLQYMASQMACWSQFMNIAELHLPGPYNAGGPSSSTATVGVRVCRN